MKLTIEQRLRIEGIIKELVQAVVTLPIEYVEEYHSLAQASIITLGDKATPDMVNGLGIIEAFTDFRRKLQEYGINK